FRHAAVLQNLASLLQQQGEYEKARERMEQSLALWRELEHQAGVFNLLNGLGDLSREEGDYRTARARFAESLEVARQWQDLARILDCLQYFAALFAAEGRMDRAATFLAAVETLREQA